MLETIVLYFSGTAHREIPLVSIGSQREREK
jgi:hypothetical protein